MPVDHLDGFIGDVVGQEGGRRAEPPVDAGDRGSQMDKRRWRRDSIRQPSRPGSTHMPSPWQSFAASQAPAEATELDGLQAAAICRPGLVMTADIVETVYAFVSAQPHSADRVHLGHALQIVTGERLLEHGDGSLRRGTTGTRWPA